MFAKICAAFDAIALKAVEDLVNLGLKRLSVSRAVIFAAGYIGDFLEQLGVDGEFRLLETQAFAGESANLDGDQHRAVSPNQDREDHDVELFGELCGDRRRDIAAAPVAVGDEDEDFGAGLALLQAGYRAPDGVANGGARRVDIAQVQVSQHAQDGVIIEGQRELQIGVAREDDHADAVVFSGFDKIFEHRNGGLKPVIGLFSARENLADLFVALVDRAHRAGHIEGKIDIDTLNLDLLD